MRNKKKIIRMYIAPNCGPSQNKIEKRFIITTINDDKANIGSYKNNHRHLSTLTLAIMDNI